MRGFLKGLEALGANAYSSGQNPTCVKLAAKYGVQFIGGVADAGCPGIMSPLHETPKIELRWGSGFNNTDKTERFNQFKEALEAIDLYNTSGNDSNLVAHFKTLNIHGRVMFYNIASKQSNANNILPIVSPYALEGLNTAEIPYGKGGTSVQEIFNQYIAPIVRSLDDTAVDLNNNNNTAVVLNTEDDEDAQLEAALALSLEQSATNTTSAPGQAAVINVDLTGIHEEEFYNDMYSS